MRERESKKQNGLFESAKERKKESTMFIIDQGRPIASHRLWLMMSKAKKYETKKGNNKEEEK